VERGALGQRAKGEGRRAKALRREELKGKGIPLAQCEF